MYVIRLERSDRFWTKKNEWGSLKDAKTFSEDDKQRKNLPICGQWIDCLQPLAADMLEDYPC